MKIGIIAHPQVGGDIQYPTNYVHWVRLSGAVPVVIPYNISSIHLYQKMNEVSGLVFTGGDIETSKYTKTQYTTYLKTIQRCIRKSKTYNDHGIYYPIWGICLGFELLLLLEESDDLPNLFQGIEIREHYSSSSLHFTSAKSRITSYFTPTEIRRFKKTQCVIHRHTYSFKKKHPFLITVALDQGYISMFEFKDYPFYGCQFHVEHPFNDASTYISYKLSMFLKEECSKN
jgi:gamma-glutamyl hydrolase